MIGEEMSNYAANKALRKLGIREDKQTVYVVHDAQIAFDDGASNENDGLVNPDSPIMTGVGSYHVIWDSKEYVCEPWTVSGNGNKNVYLGNNYHSSGKKEEDNGLPFYFDFLTLSNGTIRFHVLTDYGDYSTRTISIYTQTETITPIDPKYLPGVCLPVVEIASAEYPFSGDPVALSAEESAKFAAAAETGLPVVIKLTLNSMSLTAQYMSGLYMGNFGSGILSFAFSENGWVMGAAVD